MSRTDSTVRRGRLIPRWWRRRPARTRRIVAIVLVGAVVAAVGVTAIVSGRGWQASRHLSAAAEVAQRLQGELERGESDRAVDSLARLQDHTSAARRATGGPGWRLGGRAPRWGDDLSAVRQVALALDSLAQSGLPPLVEVASDLDPAALAPRDGAVALEPLRRAAPRITAADRAVRSAQERVAGIPEVGLIPSVRTAVTQVRRELDRAAATTATAARAAVLLPPMLGGDEPRTYLVLFQNPAEVRATGGMPGAFAVVEADQGRLRLVRQGTASADLKVFDEPVLPLEPVQRDLYTDRLATFPANVNLTPHFPTAAQLYREMYRLRFDQDVDGVIATDPVALSYLLRATGPVVPGAGPPLRAGTAVEVLLSQVYAQFESPQEQDDYFAAAAAAVFDAVLAGKAEPAAAVAALARAAGERRTLVWSADPAEQELLAGTVLAGEMPTDDGQRPTVGVFLNDGSGAKLGYYLAPAAAVSLGQRRPDDRYDLRVRVDLRSTAPTDGLPDSVLGMGLAGDPYTIRTQVLLVSPAEGALGQVRLDGQPVPVGSGRERERTVGVLMVDLPPGGARTIEADLLTAEFPEDTTPSPSLWVTPTVTSWGK